VLHIHGPFPTPLCRPSCNSYGPARSVAFRSKEHTVVPVNVAALISSNQSDTGIIRAEASFAGITAEIVVHVLRCAIAFLAGRERHSARAAGERQQNNGASKIEMDAALHICENAVVFFNEASTLKLWAFIKHKDSLP
jgi:hypothetical protein